MKNERNSNLELLIIISIIMIIILHYFNFGGFIKTLKGGEVNYYIVHILESACIIAVNIFVLISAYFLSVKSVPKISKVIRLQFLAYFYGGILFLASILFGFEKFGLMTFIGQLNLFMSGKYWFIIHYIILYLISPFINILINNINKNQHKGIIIIMSIFFSIWPSFLPYGPSNDGGYGIITFMLLYFIAAYVKKYDLKPKNSTYKLCIYIICTIIVFVFSIISGTWSPWAYNFIFNILGSVALFLVFLDINIKNKTINYIATYTFPIYLIHFNSLLINGLYNKILKISDYYYSKFLIINLVVSVIIIFGVSFLIELSRRLIIRLITKIINKIVKKYNDFEYCMDKIFYNLIYK